MRAVCQLDAIDMPCLSGHIYSAEKNNPTDKETQDRIKS